MSDLFVSYSPTDTGWVVQLARELDRFGNGRVDGHAVNGHVSTANGDMSQASSTPDTPSPAALSAAGLAE